LEFAPAEPAEAAPAAAAEAAAEIPSNPRYSVDEPAGEIASGVARLQLTGDKQVETSTSNSNTNGTSNGSSGTESLTNQAAGWSPEGQMLNEFSKLGKVLALPLHVVRLSGSKMSPPSGWKQ